MECNLHGMFPSFQYTKEREVMYVCMYVRMYGYMRRAYTKDAAAERKRDKEREQKKNKFLYGRFYVKLGDQDFPWFFSGINVGLPTTPPKFVPIDL